MRSFQKFLQNILPGKSIRNRFLFPVFFILLTSFVVEAFVIQYISKKQIRQSLDIQLEYAAHEVHDLLMTSQRTSIKSYLRGITETNLNSIQALYDAADSDVRDTEYFKNSVRQILLSQSIGKNGYLYVLDSNGKIVFHPVPDMNDVDVSEYKFIQQQMVEKEGFLQYLWKNPNESAEREKVLYMTYFEPWDWVVSASAYREDFTGLLEADDLKALVSSYKINDESYSFIVDRVGNLVVHPYYTKGNIFKLTDDQAFLSLFSSENDKTQGVIDYSWKNPGEKKNRNKRVYYTWIDEFDWFIGTSIFTDTAYNTFTRVSMVLILSEILMFFIIFLILFILSNSLSRPIVKLAARFSLEIKSLNPDYKVSRDGDEIDMLWKSFQIYLAELAINHAKLKDANFHRDILASFAEDTPLPIVRINRRGVCLYKNKAFRNVLEKDILEGFQVGPVWMKQLDKIIDKAEKNELLDDEHAFLHINSEWYLLNVSFIPESDDIFILFIDVTHQQEYKTLNEAWQKIFNHSIEGIAITDETGVIERVNDSFIQITGFSREEAIGMNTLALRSDRHDESFYHDMWAVLKATGAWSGEVWHRRKTGEAYPEWISLSAFQDSREGRTKIMTIFHDISDLRKQEDLIARMNSYDALTELPNRYLFRDELIQSVKEAKRAGEILSVIVVNFDGFKKVNDTFGNLSGDLVIKTVGLRLVSAIRDGDILARLGGDEFAILLKRMHKKTQSLEVIQRIQQAISPGILIDDVNINPAVSMGVAFFPDDGKTEEQLLKCADMALHRTKDMRRGAYSLYDSELDKSALARYDLEIALSKAVEKDELRLFYQPKIDLASGKIIGFEALIRWFRQGNKMVSPLDFIPLAEETGLIIPIGKWVIEESCRFLEKLEKMKLQDIHVGVNISARQFQEPGFYLMLRDIISKAGINAERVDLEITENIAALKTGDIISQTRNLKSSGFTISIDDFGTGYSSLQYLKELSFDTIKIDKSFVDCIEKDESSVSIIKAIISMGLSLKKHIIAEGVEKAGQADILRDMGCHSFQGYHFSKPLPEEAALALLVKHFKTEHQ